MRPIDADALLRRVEQWRDRIVDTYGKNDEYANCLAEVVMKIEDATTADVPDRKVGKWIDNNGLYQCSVCKHIWSELWWTSMCPIDRMNKMMRFCPNCGARMNGAEE